jgi:hypothetical protein
VAADAICIIVAGVVRATLPSSEFTLAWQHSVEKTRWEERYRIEGARLALVEASVAGSGAGVEPPAGARLANGRWTWRPKVAPLSELSLANSSYAGDYELCWTGGCAALARLLGSAAGASAVELMPCASTASKREEP